MSQRDARFFAMLAIVLASAVVGTSDVPTPEFHRAPLIFPAHDTAVPRVPLAKEFIRSRWVCEAEGKIPPPVVLPVPSKNPDDLGVGKLLVASRDLADPIFAKTVILLVHYDAEGVLGLMLNRRTDIPLSRVLDQFKAAKNRSDLVYLGGPVETPAAFALFRSRTKVDGADPILNGVYFINTKTLFEKVISARPKPGVLHVYLGYAGWTNKQLQNEVQVGAWFIFQADTQAVFDSDPNSLWRQMIQKTELKLAESEPPELLRLR